MTKEPIMIDDVDVSECEHRCDTHKELLADGHIKEFVHYCQITNTGCYGYNCYYKQLKRKEQECEEWKKDYATAKSMYDLCQSDFMELAKIKDNYKQALQKIKGIVFELMKADKSYKFDKYSSKILQKCEVLDEK